MRGPSSSNLLRTALSFSAVFLLVGVMTMVWSVLWFLGRVTEEKQHHGGHEQPVFPEPIAARLAFAVGHGVHLVLLEINEAQILHGAVHTP